MPHCESCICDSDHPFNRFDLFNRRCMRIARAEANKLIARLPELAARLVEAPRYRLGFTGWKLSAHTTVVAGQFLAAITAPDAPGGRRCFGVTTGIANFGGQEFEGDVTPVEIARGDSFFIGNAPTSEDLDIIWFHLTMLWGAVAAAVREEGAANA
jgi:hypothetical protein